MRGEIIDLLTNLHIASAILSLFAAPVAMAVAKGGGIHRLAGRIFFYGMLFTGLTAIVTGYWHGRYALMLISFFSMHLVASGYRALYMKRLHRGQKPTFLDKALHGGALVVNLGLLIWGLSMVLLKVKGSMSIVFISFGVIGSLFAFGQLRKFYQNRTDKRQWFYDHMVGFIAGYIAALSAFSVNVLVHYIDMPNWLAWLWPSLIGTPMLFAWVGYYKRKLAKGHKLRDMVEKIKLAPDVR